VFLCGGLEHGKGARDRGNDVISKVITLKRSYPRRESGKRAGRSYLLTFYLMYILVEFESFLVSVAMFLIVCRSFVCSFVSLLARSPSAPTCAHMRLYAAKTELGYMKMGASRLKKKFLRARL
jgi:hypothetical protein